MLLGIEMSDDFKGQMENIDMENKDENENEDDDEGKDEEENETDDLDDQKGFNL